MAHPMPAPTDLSRALLVAETTGQVPAPAWPALRTLLFTLAEAQAAGNLAQASALLDTALAPLRHLMQARTALAQARQALADGAGGAPRR